MRTHLHIGVITLLFTVLSSAHGTTVLQNFDSIPVTLENEVPADGGGWVYSSRKTNPQYPPATYNRCGWADTDTYEGSTVYDSMSTSGVDQNSPRGYKRYQYLEIDGTHFVKGNSLKQVITGGFYSLEEDCGLQLQNKEEFLEYIDNGQDPICRDGNKRVGYPYIYIVNTSLSHNPIPFEDAQGANRFSMYLKLPDHFRNGPSGNYNMAKSTINLGPYTDIGGHFYHWYYNEGGGWIHILMDGHPQHNNAWGSAELYPYVNYGIRSYDVNYFNELYRMYVMAMDYQDGLVGSGVAPYATYYDEMEFYYDPEPQNDETIASPAVAFFPQRDYAFDIGLNDKYRNRPELGATYEVKYSFSPITNGNYESAKYVIILDDSRYGFIQGNNQGRITKISPYYNGVWAPFKIEESDEPLLLPGTKIFFAIKDISNRDYESGLFDTDGDTAIVPNTGGKRRIDLIKRIDYLIPYDFVPSHTVNAGDVNGDGTVNSADVILTLQIAAGQQPEGITLDSDVNSDGRIGIEEAIKSR